VGSEDISIAIVGGVVGKLDVTKGASVTPSKRGQKSPVGSTTLSWISRDNITYRMVNIKFFYNRRNKEFTF